MLTFQTSGEDCDVVVGSNMCHDGAISQPRIVNGFEMEQGTMTDPESLGPCEPGTAVKLQGIVWQETDKGKPILSSLI